MPQRLQRVITVLNRARYWIVFGFHMGLIEAIGDPVVSLASLGRFVNLPCGIHKVGPLGPGSIAISLVILIAPFRWLG